MKKRQAKEGCVANLWLLGPSAVSRPGLSRLPEWALEEVPGSSGNDLTPIEDWECEDTGVIARQATLANLEEYYKRDKLNGTNGFFSAKFCGFHAVFCENLRFPVNICASDVQFPGKSLKICEKLRKTVPFSLSLSYISFKC